MGAGQSEVGQVLCVRGASEGNVLEICGLDRAGDGHANDTLTDTVYVIASGFGVLRWGDTALECTAGDVLFVPGGRARCFEHLDGEIKIWRISTAPGPAPAGTPD
jgi:mannose-6-phosphate isomerase-like protein (cupin superfamily)